MVKDQPSMWEIWVQSLGREDPLEEGMATHFSIFAWEILWMEEHGATVHEVAKSWTRLSTHSLTSVSGYQDSIRKADHLECYGINNVF